MLSPAAAAGTAAAPPGTAPAVLEPAAVAAATATPAPAKRKRRPHASWSCDAAGTDCGGGTPAVEVVVHERFEAALRRLRGGERVLDIGCGDGRRVLAVAARLAALGRGGGVCGVDVSTACVKYARAAAAAAGFADAPPTTEGGGGSVAAEATATAAAAATAFVRVEFREGNVEDLECVRHDEGEAFDLVLALGTLHRTHNRCAGLSLAFASISRALVPGGTALVAAHGRGSLADLFRASSAVCRRPEWAPAFEGLAFPFGLYSGGEYAEWAAGAGLAPLRVAEVPLRAAFASVRALAAYVAGTWVPWVDRAARGGGGGSGSGGGGARGRGRWARAVAEEHARWTVPALVGGGGGGGGGAGWDGASTGSNGSATSADGGGGGGGGGGVLPVRMVFVDAEFTRPAAPAPVAGPRGGTLVIGFVVDAGKLRKFFSGFMRRASLRGASFVDLTGALPGEGEGGSGGAGGDIRWAPPGTRPDIAILKHNAPRAVAGAHVPLGIPVVDAPEYIEAVLNRITMSALMAQALRKSCEDILVPQTRVLNNPLASEEEAVAWLTQHKLELPVLVKPLDARSHCGLVVAKTAAALCSPVVRDVIVQQFVPHGGVLFKVNVVGEHVFIGQRATLTDSGDVPRAVGAPADVEAETPRAPPDPDAGGADDFSAEIGRLSKFEPVSEAQQAIPPRDAILRVARTIHEHLRLTVFNFDIMRGAAGGAVHAYVVDINYFPGLTTVPCRFDVLLEHLARAAAAAAAPGGHFWDSVRQFRLSYRGPDDEWGVAIGGGEGASGGGASGAAAAAGAGATSGAPLQHVSTYPLLSAPAAAARIAARTYSDAVEPVASELPRLRIANASLTAARSGGLAAFSVESPIATPTGASTPPGALPDALPAPPVCDPGASAVRQSTSAGASAPHAVRAGTGVPAPAVAPRELGLDTASTPRWWVAAAAVVAAAAFMVGMSIMKHA